AGLQRDVGAILEIGRQLALCDPQAQRVARPAIDRDVRRWIATDDERRGADRKALVAAAQDVLDGDRIVRVLDADPAREPREGEARAVREHRVRGDGLAVDLDGVPAEDDHLDAGVRDAEERVPPARRFGGELEIAAAMAPEQECGRPDLDRDAVGEIEEAAQRPGVSARPSTIRAVVSASSRMSTSRALAAAAMSIGQAYMTWPSVAWSVLPSRDHSSAFTCGATITRVRCVAGSHSWIVSSSL